MPLVILPEMIAKAVGLPKPEIEGKGSTPEMLIKEICGRYDKLKAHMFFENDKLKDYLLLTVNGELINSQKTLKNNDKIEIFIATSGGIDLSNDEITRYARHITLAGVGLEGQQKLKESKVLIIGTGGLGSPISLYLAAVGIGNLGLVDFDVVEKSNLQRQIVHSSSTIGLLKVESAKLRLQDLNPDININTYSTMLNGDNAESLINKYDLVIDGSDNFPTRYLVNEMCVKLKKPLVYGSIFKFEGQVSVFNYNNGPCYHCLFPNKIPANFYQKSYITGVIGLLPGVIGTLQATEAVKIILNLGQSLSGRLLRYNALNMNFSEIKFTKNDNCPVCSSSHSTCDIEKTTMIHDPLHLWHEHEEYKVIEPSELKSTIDGGSSESIVLDVRCKQELDICHLPNSINIPLDELELNRNNLERDKNYILVCYDGLRSKQAANILMNSGLYNIKIMNGGIKKWIKDIDPSMPTY